MNKSVTILAAGALLVACGQPKYAAEQKDSAPVENKKIRVIFDTDANNELDDQHALAYLLFNGPTFDVEGITVNATRGGGDVDEQMAEAERIMTLCTLDGKIPLLKGANASFLEIKDSIASPRFDGYKAVDFIIQKALEPAGEPLTLIAVGKLTTVALAIKKNPSICEEVRLVWLGSNYPDPGEYNQDNDTVALNYVLNSSIPFEIATVRWGKPGGTAEVTITQSEVNERMPGLGPTIDSPVAGRHGGEFLTFGDYSVSLFEHIDYHSDPPARALFDMAAVAVVKNSAWASTVEIPAPLFTNGQWKERPSNERKIKIWENFDREAIMEDFFYTLHNYVLVNPAEEN